MLVPLKWITDYTDVPVGVDEFVNRMVMSGSNLEEVQYTGKGIEGVVVGRILSVEPHPNADKLVVCPTDIGGGKTVTVCTGATNLFPGALVPVCLDGGRIPGPLHGQPKTEEGIVIHNTEMRGIVSEGMLCSCTELGFDDKVAPYASRDGIWILPNEFEPGQDIVEALDIEGAVVDFEITPNRPDCLSMIGMAREASAVFASPLRYPDRTVKRPGAEKSEDYIRVEIKRPDLCKRYIARVIKDVKIEQSPWWLQKRLMLAGQRPINNIVDLTNFVMMEYGQPLHAFDINTVAGRHIVVDTKPAGTIAVTLDGTERVMDGEMLTINDEEKPIGIAGVMGGLNSEIEGNTETVLLEAANFLGDSIHKTSKKLGLRTEAATRFEKGIDPNLTKDACDRFCELVEELGCGTVLSGAVDVYPDPKEPPTIDIRASRISKIMGLSMSAEEMCRLLNPLEIQTVVHGDTITVTPPSVRQDLYIEEDYVEEVSRMYGFDRLPVSIPKLGLGGKLTEKQEMIDKAKNVLVGLGVSEIQTYSFVSPRSVDRIAIPQDSEKRNFVRLINPLGEDTSVMRTTLLPNMLEVLGTNFSRNIASVRLMELGNTFFNTGKGDGGLPEERYALCVGLYGAGENFYTVKGLAQELLANFGVEPVSYLAESENASYHPGRCARIQVGEKDLGTVGQVHPDVAEAYGIAAEVYAFELDFETLLSLAKKEIKYAPLPKHPAVKRDLAVVVEEGVQAGDLERCIRENAGELLEDVRLFDIYRGLPVPPGRKSAAFSLTYRSKERTLTDAEVDVLNDKVLSALKERYDASLREL